MANFSCGTIKTFQAHRLSYMALNDIPSIPKGMQVRHKCKSKKYVRVHHLELGTVKENAADRVRDGTQLSKITEETAMVIFKSKGEGTLQERAARFGTSTSTVWCIDHKKSWKHLHRE